MKNHSFRLSFLLPNTLIGANDIEQRLGEAGLFDAHIGLGLPDRVVLAFDREAPSKQQAIQSAISDVMRALPGGRLMKILD